jgi:exodeoxyribonuclease VII large subunit
LKRLDLPVSLVQRPLDDAKRRLDALWRLAQQVSPDGPLKRGYARVSGPDGSLIANRAAAIKAGDLDLHFQDGIVGATVTDKVPAKPKPAPPSASRVKKAPDDRQQDLF